jgi:hypothetical protein
MLAFMLRSRPSRLLLVSSFMSGTSPTRTLYCMSRLLLTHFGVPTMKVKLKLCARLVSVKPPALPAADAADGATPASLALPTTLRSRRPHIHLMLVVH